MGAPARKREIDRGAARTPDLRVLRGSSKRSRSRTHTRSAAAIRTTSIVAIVCFCALTLFGLGRVWLSSQATQAGIESSEINGRLREARSLSDELEIKYSLLSRSDRIRTYAQGTLQMGQPAKVGYIDLSPDVTEAVAELPDSAFVDTTARADMGGLMRLVASLLPEGETGAGVVSAP